MEKRPLPQGLLALRPGLDPETTPHPDGRDAPGRPPNRYSLGLHRQIVDLIRAGNRPQVAAAACGIPYSIFSEWMRRGRDGDIHLHQLYVDVEQAMAQAEIGAVAVVQENSALNAESAKWWLERARADGYSKQVTNVVKSELDGVIEKLRENLPPAEFVKVLGIIAGEGALATVPTDDE